MVKNSYTLEYVSLNKCEPSKRVEDIRGKTFNKLTVKEATKYNGRIQWFCQCECGKYVIVHHNKLRSGKTKTCGFPSCKIRSIKYNTENFKTKLTEIHGSKYDFSKVVYTKISNKVDVTCLKHGEFKSLPSVLLRGGGCSKCGDESMVRKRLKSTEEFIKEANIVHKDKYVYTYTKYKGARRKLNIICPLHGDFSQTAGDHLTGYGCNLCAAEYRGEQSTFTQEQFLSKCEEVHGNLYNYSKTEYVKNNVDIIVTCNKHGDFRIKAGYHSTRGGCPDCNVTGYNKKNTGSFYIVLWEQGLESFIKVGITNKKLKIRVSSQKCKTFFNYRILYNFRLKDGYKPFDIERYVLNNFECGVISKEDFPDGYTETTSIDNLPKILEYIKSNYDLDPEDYKYSE